MAIGTCLTNRKEVSIKRLEATFVEKKVKVGFRLVGKVRYAGQVLTLLGISSTYRDKVVPVFMAFVGQGLLAVGSSKVLALNEIAIDGYGV